MKKNQHVVPSGNQWAVKGEGNSIKTRITQTQSEAIDIARTIARKELSELVIHGKDGRIRQKNSYGNDPFPPKG
ncbi:DUF2188 domain-containing protein [Macellibacteroides fermentans]|uniref:DUF2188 domain-containing protein n=1 Tax=Parabacteroides chartae TaxID=1037355 RepID=A0A1T5F0U5_9BACT|nr:DUF2188 domain-containing protein [Parabacteroides chartae]SKB89708.1 hypothetical protein SAMN05660349_03247 [Parabacteroides chartae]